MDIRFTAQVTEEGTRKAVRLYYMCHFRVFRYYLIDLALAFVVLVGEPGELYANAIAGVLLVLFLGWGYLAWTFDDYWKDCRKNFMAAKLFGRPANCRITDEYIETEIDGEGLKCVFRDEVAAFYCRHDVLMLFDKNNALLCAFSRSALPRSEDFDQFAALFRNGDYQDRSKFPVTKALLPWSIGAALLVIGWRLL